MKTLITAILIGSLLALPLRADDTPPVDPGPVGPPQESALALCVVACCIVAVGVIYIVSKKCAPQYYWLMDDSENPPRTWVGTATDKECKINEWKKIGGPYKRPEDAPPEHPPYTNRVERAVSMPLSHTVESSPDGQTWTAVYTERCDSEDFGYTVTNTASSQMFRIIQAP